MSFIGNNGTSRTFQIWDGTKWIEYPTLVWTATGINATVTSQGGITLNAVTNDVSLVATNGQISGNGQTGVQISATTGALQLNATDPAGTVSLTAGNTWTAQAGGAATLASSAGFATLAGATGVGISSSGGDIQIDSAVGNATLEGQLAVNVRSVTTTATVTGQTGVTVIANTGNLNVVATTGFTTLNGATGVGINSSGGDINVDSATGNATLEGQLTTTVRSVASNVLIDADTDMALVANAGAGILTVTAAQTNFSGNVTVAGTAMSVDSQITLEDRFIDLNVGMTAPGAVTSGTSTNTNAVGPTTTVAAGGFTATTVAVTSSAGFAINDVIEVAGAANASNRGRFAVSAVAAGLLTIKAVPLNSPILQNTFVADTTVAGTVTKITVAATRFSGTAFELTSGNTTDAATWTWASISRVFKYSVGPAFSGAEFSTIQSAVNQAVTDGNGGTYGGVVIEVYPRSYGEAVVIPDTLSYFHLVGLGDGGSTGPFTTSITVNLRAGDFDFSITGFAATTWTLTQAVSVNNQSYVQLIDCWVFGSATFNAADARILMQDCHLYGGASALTANVRRLTMNDVETLADVAHSLTAVEEIVLNGCTMFGRPTLTAPTIRLDGGNVFTSATVPIITDASTTTARFANNAVNYTGAGSVTGVYNKTAASALSAGGNTFTENITFPYTVGAGTLNPRGLDTDTIFVVDNLTATGPNASGAVCSMGFYENHVFNGIGLAGSQIDVSAHETFLGTGTNAAGSQFLVPSYENHILNGIGTAASQFNATNHDDFVVSGLGSGVGLFNASSYHIHQFQSDGLAGSSFAAQGHRTVLFDSGGPGETFSADVFDEHLFRGDGTSGDFDCSDHRSFLCTSAGGALSRFDVIDHLITNFEGQNPTDPASLFLIENYYNVELDGSGIQVAGSLRAVAPVSVTDIDTFPLSVLNNSVGATGADTRIYSGNRNPNGIVTATGGSVYLRSNGTVWICSGVGTVWVQVQAGTALTGLLYAVFASEGAFGSSGAAPAINFTTLGQKASITLTANATFSFTFPGVGNYILRITQDGTGSRTVTLPATSRAAGGNIDLGGGANEVSLWAIYWNGTNSFISSMPDVGAGAPTVTLV